MTPRMDDKTIVLTGATSGVGREAARALAPTGARLLLVGRDPARTAALVSELSAHNPAVEGLVADLSSQAEVRRLAREIRGRVDRIDVLLNNAGAIFTTRAETVDGIERTFALNHLAYFLLTTLLLDVLTRSAPSRIVNVASEAHRKDDIAWDDLGRRRWRGQGWPAYRQSKLANILFTRELALRLRGSGVTANSIHPGFVDSGFGRNNGRLWRVIMTALRPIQRDAVSGADTLVWAATDPSLTGVSGEYFADRARKTPSRAALDDTAARRLWDVSEGMVARPREPR